MTPRQTLLISGPSGGGKSTLIHQLAAGTLAPEISSRLPAHAGEWPIIEANDVIKGDLSTESLLQSQPKLTAGSFTTTSSSSTAAASNATRMIQGWIYSAAPLRCMSFSSDRITNRF